MISLKQIRQDLRDIRYYYSKQKMFDGLANSLGQNDIVERAAMYNKAIQKAPIKLYDVYISLYINNNTQETLAFDWGVSSEYIKMLNKGLCEFLQKQLA